MTDRAKEFMSRVWEKRNNGADTEEKLVSSILQLSSDYVKSYSAQSGIIVLDKNDLQKLSEEILNIEK